MIPLRYLRPISWAGTFWRLFASGRHLHEIPSMQIFFCWLRLHQGLLLADLLNYEALFDHLLAHLAASKGARRLASMEFFDTSPYTTLRSVGAVWKHKSIAVLTNMTRMVHLRKEGLQGYEGIITILREIQKHNGVIERIDNITDATQLFKTEGERPTVIASDDLLLGVAGEKVKLRAEAFEYVCKGGTIIVAWPFDFDGEDADHFFKMFDLPWKSGAEIHDAPYVLDQPRFQHFDTLPIADRVDMRCGLVNNVEAADCLYVRNKEGGMDAQLYIANPELPLDTVAAAFTKIKDGTFGYVGNDGEYQEMNEVVLSMLGLK